MKLLILKPIIERQPIFQAESRADKASIRPTLAIHSHMFSTRRSFYLRHVFNPLGSPRRALSGSQTSQKSPKSPTRLESTQLRATTPVAHELQDTQVWMRKTSRGRPKKTVEGAPPAVEAPTGKKAGGDKPTEKRAGGDKSRVNIVSDKLCDDVLSYIGPSLERHKGCDIIDIYPGAGTWSRKLHDLLSPRSHILMEPDTDLYQPFLKSLLDKPGTQMVPKSGIIWKELNSILTPEYLPHQRVVERGSEEANKRNDTLLITANVAFHPPKRFSNFNSIAALIIHQFIDAIRSGSLFHKYGQVRVLMWTRVGDKSAILPRCMQRHTRTAIEGELYCESIREVAGSAEPESDWFVRDTILDKASALSAATKMRDANVVMPPGRASVSFREAMSNLENRVVIDPSTTPPHLARPYERAMAELQEADGQQLLEHGTDDHVKMRRYQWRQRHDNKLRQQLLDAQQALDAITALRKSGTGSATKIRAMEMEWETLVTRFSQGAVSNFYTYKDNLHYWRQDPPLMHWDRRDVEPLIVSADEFFPNVECSLLDIQPKPVNPLLRQVGEHSERASDAFDLIMKALSHWPTQPMDRALDSVWPGAADYIIPRCASFHDPDQGGINVKATYTHLTPRMLNCRQWEELLERWFEWPFRPSFHDLVSRSQDDTDELEDGGGPMGAEQG